MFILILSKLPRKQKLSTLLFKRQRKHLEADRRLFSSNKKVNWQYLSILSILNSSFPFFFFYSDNLLQKLPDNSWFSPPPISELKQRVLWGEFCQIQHCSLGGRGLKIIKNELSGIFLPGIVGRRAVYKFTKLSKIWFSMKCFTGDFLRFFTKKHQNLALAWQAEYSPSNPSISGIFLKFPNFLRS